MRYCEVKNRCCEFSSRECCTVLAYLGHSCPAVDLNMHDIRTCFSSPRSTTLSGHRRVQWTNMHELLWNMLSALSYTLRECQWFIITLFSVTKYNIDNESVMLMHLDFFKRGENQEKVTTFLNNINIKVDYTDGFDNNAVSIESQFFLLCH